MSYTPIYEYKHRYSQLAAGSLTMWAPLPADGSDPDFRPLNGLIQTPQWSFSSAQDDDTVVADVSTARESMRVLNHRLSFTSILTTKIRPRLSLLHRPGAVTAI